MHRLAVTPVCLAVAFGFGLAAPAAASELDDLVSDYLGASGLTGVSVAISRNGDLETAFAGTLDADGVARVTRDTRFYIASCGKSAVAAAILAYVSEGKLDLDAKVWPLIDDIDGISELDGAGDVTLRQLLDHSAGLADYLDDDFVAYSVEAGASGVTVLDAMQAAYGYPATFAPGTASDYSNTNYVLLGHILAGLAGSLDQALKDKVIRPAGMAATTVGIGGMIDNAARGRGEDGTDYSVMAWASTLGDGPLVSTPSDMTRFAEALFGKKVLVPETLLTEMTTGSAQDPGYGLGMGIETDDWGTWYGHSGGIDGYEADFRYYPEYGVALAYAANGTTQTEDALLDLVADWAFAED